MKLLLAEVEQDRHGNVILYYLQNLSIDYFHEKKKKQFLILGMEQVVFTHI